MPNKTYRVSFIEWARYSLNIDASSPQEAITRAYERFCDEGPEAFKCKDNGTECWDAKAQDEERFEVNHPTDIEAGPVDGEAVR